MARITVPPVTIRTTSDGRGRPHLVIAGIAVNPSLALSVLQERAQSAAEDIAAGHEGQAHGDSEKWLFEVVDVRLEAGPMPDGSRDGWTAYGTLATNGAPPTR
jgi:hypothetical protein